MVVTLSFTSVALTALAYEYVKNPAQFQKELEESRNKFSLLQNPTNPARKRLEEELNKKKEE